MKSLSQMYIMGWPFSKSECALLVRPYWTVQNELSVIDGVLFKGKRIVIPLSLRKELLNKVHEGHQGIEKCKSRSREAFYWPGINTDISEMVTNVKRTKISEKTTKGTIVTP